MVMAQQDAHHDTIVIQPSDPRYAAQQQAVMERVYDCCWDEPDAEVFCAEMFRHHQAIFPAGQFIALHAGRVVGFTVSMLLPFDPQQPFIEPWFTTISDGWLHRHDPAADWMYGVESCVETGYQSRGVGSGLMNARFDIVRDMNLRGIVAGSALISYRENTEKHGMFEPEDYIRLVASGTLYDTNLTKQIKKGFRPVAVIPNYLRDSHSMGWGAVIVWRNPDHDPAKGRGTPMLRTYHVGMRSRIS
ncbi:MAG: GNAT family N-acetyltransferase [bacterium]|nr:GNAT family N-acetyltransferase [bacterium]